MLSTRSRGAAIALTITAACVFSSTSSARLMTVADLKNMIEQGPAGKVAATAFVQGAVEGMAGMDSLHQKEQGTPVEFCGLFEAHEKGQPARHPADQTEKLVAAWERQGRMPMSTPAVDMVLMYLTARYGC